MEATKSTLQNSEINKQLLEINRKDTKMQMISQDNIDFIVNQSQDDLTIKASSPAANNENVEQWTWNYTPTNGHCYSYPNIQDILDPISSISIDVDLPTDKSIISDILDDARAISNQDQDTDRLESIQESDICHQSIQVNFKDVPQLLDIDFPDPIHMSDSHHQITYMKLQQKIRYPTKSSVNKPYSAFYALFKLKEQPVFIPNPVRHISESSSISEHPTFCRGILNYFKRQ